MTRNGGLLRDFEHIFRAARQSDDGQRCAVAPHPDLRDKIIRELQSLRANEASALRALARFSEPRRPGFNDGLVIPPEEFPLGTPFNVIRDARAQRAALRGVVRVIVILVDFDDHQIAQTAAHFENLFFSTGVVPTKSVREYFQEVTHGLIDIQGQVAGPFRLPETLAAYANGASGIGGATPNAATMARDAVLASDPTVNFAPFDNDGNGFVDAFIVVHAGPGAEVTGNPNQIWSHKWVLDGGSRSVDGTKIFAYLTVPEDARIGVCCHELGHLLFGFPDLYDTDGSSEGAGNWCLMAGGSWGGGGETPVHPSAWCKANQGWANIDNRTSNSVLNMPDVKDSHVVYRLWKDGGSASEYFLLEHRRRDRFDVSLPADGLLIWHIDESIATNTDENHYKVALMQADGRRDLELAQNRGDQGDPFPGSANNTAFTDSSKPNSKSYAGLSTCVAVSDITASGAVVSANVQVSCKPSVAVTSVWPNGKVYFFKGSQYARYDVATEKVDSGWPKPIQGNWPGFPAPFTAGINAAVMWTTGKVYFFKGSQYIRYNVAADKVDAGYPRPIAGNWPGLWTSNIDAAVVWPNGKAYFFKGSQYARYDLASDKVDPGWPKPIQGNWPGFPASFAAGINAAVMWTTGKVYFFKGSQYIRYDVVADKVDTGYPKPISGYWPGLWTSNIDA